ncbi:MAG: hypothetical protein JST46_18050 [Bacteroidetes bacterium]|nr:hypothetical protein [Bacteroidota bacterium]
MRKISSDFTALLKYVAPWAIIFFLTLGTIGAFVAGQFYLGLGVIIVGAPIIGFTRSMLMNLKNVFLDKENKVIIVKGQKVESIPYGDIKEILRPWTPPYIATVQLTKDYSFGRTFTFIPDDHPLFWDNYDEDLKTKIRK